LLGVAVVIGADVDGGVATGDVVFGVVGPGETPFAVVPGLCVTTPVDDDPGVTEAVGSGPGGWVSAAPHPETTTDAASQKQLLVTSRQTPLANVEPLS
jgi:hypothetical protein